MIVNLQPLLENDVLRMQPLQPGDLEALYEVASDPLIWEQHPNKNRWQRAEFENYFSGAIESGGALLVVDKENGETAGCTRFYEYNETEKSVLIGYTFIARKYWGRQFNTAMKKLMIDHAFGFADTVLFHIGAFNIRSQMAIGRIGAVKHRELPVAYHGEAASLNFEYILSREAWEAVQAQ
jgi:RimJ/RimL family protein N-acetyltransferase